MAHVELDEVTRDQLREFRDLLLRWNLRFNLTSIREPEDVDRKLIGDALNMLPAIDDAIAAWSTRRDRDEAGDRPRMIDIGSGAGFPGMVLKIARPDLEITLMEATGKKVGFLSTAIEELRLDGIEAVHGRAEELGHRAGYRERFDLATARAVASLPALMELCLPFLSAGGIGIFPKGMEIAEELAAGERAAALVGGTIVSSDPIQTGDGVPVTRLVIAVKLRANPESISASLRPPRQGAAREGHPMTERIFYRKEKLRGACWEYQIDGGWLAVPTEAGDRQVLHHRFTFYRPREVEVRTATGTQTLERTGAEQWFFPDRWFSLLRFTTVTDATVGYYVNFSKPLVELKANYYRDLDLELDLWLDPDGTPTELDRDEFDLEINSARMEPAWAEAVNTAYEIVSSAVASSISELGPDLDIERDPKHGLPRFILRS